MKLTKKFFSPLPDNEGLDPRERNNEDQGPQNGDNISEGSHDSEEQAENKSGKTSLRDALQEWSNGDARDIVEDDSTPLRSGL